MDRPARKRERGEAHPVFFHRIPQQQRRCVHHPHIENRSAAYHSIAYRKDGYWNAKTSKKSSLRRIERSYAALSVARSGTGRRHHR